MKTSMRRTFGIVLVVAILMVAVTAVGSASGPERVYRVTLTNLTDHQPFTPPVLATHKRKVHVFQVGETASFGVKEVAENGNVPALVDELMAVDDFEDVQVAANGEPAPLLPGQSIEATVEGEDSAKYLSFVSMLICTNDGFAGLDGVRLPNKVGRSVTVFADSYDAGSEINTEDFADLVPPCPALSGIATDKMGTGTSNTVLAQGGVVMHHAGIQGVTDLTVASHGWSDPAAKVEITRVR